MTSPVETAFDGGAGATPQLAAKEPRIVAVIGAGQMGRGIAQVALKAGHSVWLLDASAELADGGRERLRQSFQQLVDRGKVGAESAEEQLDRLRATADYAMLTRASVVIEAATENLEVKTAIFRQADAHALEAKVLASNTSSIAITQLAAVTQRPERVIGIHFMNPAPRMELVEVIRALQTSDETYELGLAWVHKLGKTAVTSKDMPGFVVNRLLVPMLNEACFALQEGLATQQDIDTAIKLGLNHPMGPFELADLIGLDTVLAIAELLHRELGEDKYRPAPLLRSYVAAGRLGRKSGRGFYEYNP